MRSTNLDLVFYVLIIEFFSTGSQLRCYWLRNRLVVIF